VIALPVKSASAGRTALALALMIAGACREPTVGEREGGRAPAPGPRIVLEDAWLDLHGHVVVTFAATDDEVPLPLDDVMALEPRFTLATLTAHPVDGIPSWKSQLLTGAQVAPKLPPGGPGTPGPQLLTSVRQPGWEAPASLIDLGGGRYRYVFEDALADFDAGETVRVGVWLDGAPFPTRDTSATHDFRPSGGPVEERETVLDESCTACHEAVARHGPRTRVRLCLTCHTWQHTDPDTIDPASLSTVATTDPNPLELGRLLHRIHRGKRLPTLYKSTSQAVPAPPLGAGNDLPLPFSPENVTSAIPIMPAVLGKKYTVVSTEGEAVFGRVVLRMDVQQVTTTIQAIGNTYSRDLRSCDACHAGAPQGDEVSFGISRRICAGCHPDVWFGTAPITDVSHVAHLGGPQADDGACVGCHVDPAGTTAPKLYAPISEAHVPPGESPRADRPVLEIVRVEDLVPGGKPRVTFRAWDRLGPIAPTLGAPVPAYDPDAAVTSRKLSLSIYLAGATTTDDVGAPELLNRIQSGGASGSAALRGPDPASISTTSGTDEYVYAFTTTLPLTATGTWAVAIQASRTVKRPHYDKGTDTFNWPYTGETVRENADTVMANVSTATGTWPPEGPAPRRKVVSTEKCLRCHGRFEIHGGARNDVQYCLFCHHPRYTDYGSRRKVGGSVDLGQTMDGVEERSLQLKVIVHRLHTGRRTGGASLEGIRPYLIGRYFREGLFPGDLANCTLCHEGKSYLVENVPAGAMPTFANETGTLRHSGGSSAHPPDEVPTPPITSACLACHAAGPTFSHVALHGSGGVETCGPCHEKGPLSVEVAHGLAPPAGGVKAAFSSIVEGILVPRCAIAACHSGNPPVAFPALDAGVAWESMVGVASGQASMNLVEPGEPEASYLVYKLRADAASAGGAGLPMPTDGLLDAADVAAVEAWILNGAPDD
jgi:OmcA/MtrC family decaheme c-type cytochrome